MSSRIRFIALLCMGSSLALAAGLQNGSFEDPDNPEDVLSDKAAAWGRWGHWINRETGWSPTRSGDALLGYHHFRIETPDNSGVYQDVSNVPPRSLCTFGVWLFKDPDTNVESVEVRLEPAEGGATLASAVYPRKDLSTGRWTALSVTATNPLQGIRALIIVTPKEKAPRTGALKFDDAGLEVAARP